MKSQKAQSLNFFKPPKKIPSMDPTFSCLMEVGPPFANESEGKWEQFQISQLVGDQVENVVGHKAAVRDGR